MQMSRMHAVLPCSYLVCQHADTFVAHIHMSCVSHIRMSNDSFFFLASCDIRTRAKTHTHTDDTDGTVDINRMRRGEAHKGSTSGRIRK